MIYHLQNVLSADELRQLRELAAHVAWGDGRRSAGSIAAPHKHNTEAPHDTREALAASDIALKALRRHPQFFNAALPAIMSPLMMNRYAEGMEYGDHCDAAIEVIPGGFHTKLPAGDLILYPADTVHHVTRVTRGTRLAMVFWTQSMVRDLHQRTLLYNLAQTLTRLEQPLAETPEITQLYASYYNLLRMWATP